MRRVRTLAALTGAALGAAAAPASAAPRSTPTTPAVGVAARTAAPRGAVTGVSVVPNTGRAAVVIAVDSAVDLQDFTLASPHRIVLDLTGATLGMPARFYDKVARGGITNVRIAQYRADIVRVVIELDGDHKYEITRGANDVRIAVDGESGKFAAWHAGTQAADRGEAPASSDRADAVASAAAAAAPRTPDAPARMASGRNDGPKLLQQRSQQPRITVTYQDADVRDVLAAFASFSGRTIVVGTNVTGTVSAEIRDQPWDVALQAILQAQGLAAAEDSYGIITVDSYQNILAKQATEPLVTQLVSINYAKSSSLIPTISSLLSRDCGSGGGTGAAAPQSRASCVVRGAVVADTATNTLLITEVPSRINDVIAYVRDLDVRDPQVSIKAKIIFVSRTNIEQLGVAYDLGTANQFNNTLVQRTKADGTVYTSADNVISVGGDALSAIANAGRAPAANALQLVYSTMLGKFSLTSFIDALQEIRLSDTQAEPSVVTLNNRRAEILVGQETPIRIVDAGQGGGTTARATVAFKESGIILGVTPQITNNRQIKMELHAEQSELQAATSDLGYTFNKRRSDNQLLVNDGETAVIGGLTLTQVTSSRSGIPFLVDLPLIGRLFGQTTQQEVKQDLLILITPHIIDEGEAVGQHGMSGGGAAR